MEVCNVLLICEVHCFEKQPYEGDDDVDAEMMFFFAALIYAWFYEGVHFVFENSETRKYGQPWLRPLASGRASLSLYGSVVLILCYCAMADT